MLFGPSSFFRRKPRIIIVLLYFCQIFLPNQAFINKLVQPVVRQDVQPTKDSPFQQYTATRLYAGANPAPEPTVDTWLSLPGMTEPRAVVQVGLHVVSVLRLFNCDDVVTRNPFRRLRLWIHKCRLC